MSQYDREPQGRRDPLTGETYYLHVPESNRREKGSGYVDPFAENGQAAIDYRPEEIAGFERSAERVARTQSTRPDYERPIARPRVEIDGPLSELEPFASFTRKLELLLRPRNSVREIIATLGPMRGDQASPRAMLETRGVFFLETVDDEEHYTMMKDPPKSVSSIEEETFDVDDGTLEALIQERLRVAVRLNPFFYRFYFA